MTSTASAEDSNRPLDTAVRQQRMIAWNPILHPVWVIVTLFAMSVAFIPIGLKLNNVSDSIVEYSIKYDSYDPDALSADSCGIDGIQNANQGVNCQIQFNVKEDMAGPVMVYYEIENFHQNYRAYEQSRDDYQLLGSLKQTALQATKCEPLNKLGNITLNPCGLIANTFFNDVFEFKPTDSQIADNFAMIEEGIAWGTDLEYKYKQPDGFVYEECDCDDCDCDGSEWSCEEKYVDPKTNKCYRYFYPNDDTTQYLYETYPMISPIEGVENEHFVVWMRIATFANFRKLYGFFDRDIKAGETLTFDVTANWDVRSFRGAKSLVITTTSTFGGKNKQFGNCFIGLGGIFLIVSIFFTVKQIFRPRRLADIKYLKYKVE